MFNLSTHLGLPCAVWVVVYFFEAVSSQSKNILVLGAPSAQQSREGRMMAAGCRYPPAARARRLVELLLEQCTSPWMQNNQPMQVHRQV